MLPGAWASFFSGFCGFLRVLGGGLERIAPADAGNGLPFPAFPNVKVCKYLPIDTRNTKKIRNYQKIKTFPKMSNFRCVRCVYYVSNV